MPTIPAHTPQSFPTLDDADFLSHIEQVMSDARQKAASGADPASIPFADEVPEQRSERRRRARIGTRAEVRRGRGGIGPNVGFGLIEVSESGARVILQCAVPMGDVIEVALWSPAGSQACRSAAVVRWCRPTADGTFVAGVQFRRRLPINDLLLISDS